MLAASAFTQAGGNEHFEAVAAKHTNLRQEYIFNNSRFVMLELFGGAEPYESERLLMLQQLRKRAEEELGRLREVLHNTRHSWVKLQLEEAMLSRIRAAAKESYDLLKLSMKKEEEEATEEGAARMVEIATCDQRMHVLEVQEALELQEHLASTQQLLAAADKQFQSALTAALTESNDFRGFTWREAEEIKHEVEALRRSLDQHLTKIRETFQNNTEDLEQQCNAELWKLGDSLDLRGNVAIHEVEEQKSLHINMLKAFNDEAISKLKTYYQGIARDNLQLVKKLRDENGATAANNKRLKKEIDETSLQSAQIRKPLQDQEALRARLKVQLRFIENDKLVLRNLRRRNQQIKRQIENARMEVRSLEYQTKETNRTIGKLQEEISHIRHSGGGLPAVKGILMHLSMKEALEKLESSLHVIEYAKQSCEGSAEPTGGLVRDAIMNYNWCKSSLHKKLTKSTAAYSNLVASMRSCLNGLYVPCPSLDTDGVELEESSPATIQHETKSSPASLCPPGSTEEAPRLLNASH
ncbi:dynein regulatory complex subunit 4 [Cyclospora cayetanensis]|uniref:Dynein regulatory complex subunit 4 n=1 Tax=Cyclospora cayetanensis TaxID=88456 RepID=A0A6P6RPY7_9EIME|nr:dynein regulatory complex subunit 4 [Cyclospora cayetanensis]